MGGFASQNDTYKRVVSNIAKSMTKQDIYNFKILLLALNKIAESGINEISEKWVLETLPKALPLLTHLVVNFQIPKIERITINRRVVGTNKRIHNINFLKYPPADKVTKYGRCNMPGTSVLYGADFITTALSEMRPKTGDLITKSIWKLKKEHSFKICPIFHVQPTNGTFNPRSYQFEKNFFDEVIKFPEDEREAVIELSKFIAHYFSKAVNIDNDKDYLYSAYFADKILNELDNGTIEGIYYPSVKSSLSFENIALKTSVFDEYFVLDEVDESVIFADPSNGRGGLLMRGITSSKEFDLENGKILWKDSLLYDQELKALIDKYKLDLN